VRFRGGFIAATVCSESRQVGAVALGKQSRFAARSVGGRAFRVDEIPTNVGTSGEREFEGRSRATFAGGEIRSMSKNTEKPAVRITNQFRKGDSMVYDLSCKDVLLTLQVTSRGDADGAGAWHVEAFARHVPERPILDQPGKTPSEALRAVANSWTVRIPAARLGRGRCGTGRGPSDLTR
jgi:hypothetical protein